MASPVSGPPRHVMEKKMRTDVDAPLPAAASSTRDWSELPLDALASVFRKLDAIEILVGAGLVCHSWLQAAKLPDLWRSVDMADHELVNDQSRCLEPKINGDALCAMARVAVDRSGGQMEEFVGRQFVTDELLNYIGDKSPALKTLGLMSCSAVSNQGFTHLIAKCPMLEDLKLVNCDNIGGRDIYQAAGMACARLNRFTLRKEYYKSWPRGEALGVAAMHELRSLTLFNSDVTNGELWTILEGCPHLEHLDLRGCLNIVDNNKLRARCASIKLQMLPCNNYPVIINLNSVGVGVGVGLGPRHVSSPQLSRDNKPFVGVGLGLGLFGGHLGLQTARA